MKHKKTAIALIAILALCIACTAYVSDYYRADETAVAAMTNFTDIRIERNGNAVAFIPDAAETGSIFYPGGKVEHTAYAPLMRALAENNVLCVLTEMPQMVYRRSLAGRQHGGKSFRKEFGDL